MCNLGPVSALFGNAPRAGDPSFVGPTRALDSGFVGPTRAPTGLPSTQPADYTTGELMKDFAGVASAFGTAQEFSDLAEQREVRAGQILQATKQSIELKRLQQGINMGARKAAIGKSGVKMSGSAAKVVERQEVLDEMAIEAAKNRGVLQIENEYAEAATAKSKSTSASLQGLQRGYEFGGKALGFELG